MVLATTVAALLVTVGIILFQSRSGKPAAEGVGTDAASQAPTLGASECLRVMREVLEADRPEQLEGVIRATAPPEPEALAALAELRSQIDSGRQPTWLGLADNLVESPTAIQIPLTTGAYRVALVLPGDDGRPLVDLPALLASSSRPWERITSTPEASTTVRAHAKLDHFHNSYYRESDGWRCYQLIEPQGDGRLSGYTRAGSPQDLALQAVLKRIDVLARDREELHSQSRQHLQGLPLGFKPGEAVPARVTIEVIRHEPSGPGQVEITRVLADDWALHARPLEEILAERRAAP